MPVHNAPAWLQPYLEQPEFSYSPFQPQQAQQYGDMPGVKAHAAFQDKYGLAPLTDYQGNVVAAPTTDDQLFPGHQDPASPTAIDPAQVAAQAQGDERDDPWNAQNSWQWEQGALRHSTPDLGSIAGAFFPGGGLLSKAFGANKQPAIQSRADLLAGAPQLGVLQESDGYSGAIGDARATVGYDATGRGYDANRNPTNAFIDGQAWMDALRSEGHGHKDAQYALNPGDPSRVNVRDEGGSIIGTMPTPVSPPPRPATSQQSDDNNDQPAGNQYSIGESFNYDDSGIDWDDLLGSNKGGMVPGYNLGGPVSLSDVMGFNDGGSVPMYNEGGQMMNHPFQREGSQFDTVPAKLTPGEFVIDADSAHQFKPVLEQINAWEPGDDMRSMMTDIFNTMEDVTVTKKHENGNSMTFKSPNGQRMMDLFSKGGM